MRAALAEKATDCAFVHADCDGVEPAGEALERRLEQQLQDKLPVTVHAVVPAWELEAWWFLWPEACVHVCSSWRLPDRYRGRRVGRIRNAKEELRRALRPRGRAWSRTPDYEPSDAPDIAAAVRELGMVLQPQAQSASFTRFKAATADCCA